jgi:hypothetical protein
MISRSQVTTPGPNGEHQLRGRVAGVQTLAAHAQNHPSDAALGRSASIASSSVVDRANRSSFVTINTSPL